MHIYRDMTHVYVDTNLVAILISALACLSLLWDIVEILLLCHHKNDAVRWLQFIYMELVGMFFHLKKKCHLLEILVKMA